jgi:DNA processing protein
VGGRADLTGAGAPGAPAPGAGVAPQGSDPADLEALVTLRLLPGVGDRLARRLLRGPGSRQATLEALRRERAPGSVPPSAIEALRAGRVFTEARRIVASCGRLGIEILGVDDPAYPERLQRLHDPPAVLYLRGATRLLHGPAIGIVGSRRSTAVGRRMAERVARELSSVGITVVSGLAAGIDGAAHRGALEGPGSTVAVLGRGPDRAYPLDHVDLFRRVGREGLLASEFPPGLPARPHHFPRRNRVLAALGFGVVVVEARDRSGALLTVDHALDLGIEVMAVPGSAEALPSRGTNRLLRDGAHLVTSGREVLEALGVIVPEPPERQVGSGRRVGELADAQRSLFHDPAALLMAGPSAPGSDAWRAGEASVTERVTAFLGSRPVPVEVLLEGSGLPPSRTLAALSRLELAGRARREPEGWILVGDAA